MKYLFISSNLLLLACLQNPLKKAENEKQNEKNRKILLGLLVYDNTHFRVEYAKRFLSIPAGLDQFQSFAPNCQKYGGVLMSIEQIRYKELSGTRADSSVTCADDKNPTSACLNVQNLDSCQLSEELYDNNQLAAFYNSSPAPGRSVLFCFPKSCSTPGLGANYDFLSRAQNALNAWNINLAKDLLADQRSMGNSFQAHNPANWITASGDDCKAIGSHVDEANCPFKGTSVIGVCETRYIISNGQIIDSTILIRKSYQESTLNSLANKQSVWTHEVGHCLGLKHTNDLKYLMYPSTSGADNPHPDELAAIANAYSPLQEPSTANRDKFYHSINSGSIATRHFTFPQFFISSSIGNALAIQKGSFKKMEVEPGKAPDPGQSFDGPLGVIQHELYSDGSERIKNCRYMSGLKKCWQKTFRHP